MFVANVVFVTSIISITFIYCAADLTVKSGTGDDKKISYPFLQSGDNTTKPVITLPKDNSFTLKADRDAMILVNTTDYVTNSTDLRRQQRGKIPSVPPNVHSLMYREVYKNGTEIFRYIMNDLTDVANFFHTHLKTELCEESCD